MPSRRKPASVARRQPSVRSSTRTNIRRNVVYDNRIARRKSALVETPIRYIQKISPIRFGSPITRGVSLVKRVNPVLTKRARKSALRDPRASVRNTLKCKERRAFKADMMKKLAAQIKGSGNSLHKWREKRAQNRTRSTC